jgi:hypothetical protein
LRVGCAEQNRRTRPEIGLLDDLANVVAASGAASAGSYKSTRTASGSRIRHSAKARYSAEPDAAPTVR